MPKNYLLLKNYELTEQFYLFRDMKRVRLFYNELEEYLVESAQLYLKDLDDIIITRKTATTDQHMFYDHMLEIEKLWKQEPCNILYMDLDTVMIKPVDIFNHGYTDFSMLNGNCGVRYYPATMNPELWKIQSEEMKNWNTEAKVLHDVEGDPEDYGYKWAREQDIFNTMLSHSADYKQAYSESHDSGQKFFTQWVWNSFKPYEGQPILHTNGTGQQFDSLKLTRAMLKYSKRNGYHAIDKVLNDPLHSVRQPEVDWNKGIDAVVLIREPVLTKKPTK